MLTQPGGAPKRIHHTHMSTTVKKRKANLGQRHGLQHPNFEIGESKEKNKKKGRAGVPSAATQACATNHLFARCHSSCGVVGNCGARGGVRRLRALAIDLASAFCLPAFVGASKPFVWGGWAGALLTIPTGIWTSWTSPL